MRQVKFKRLWNGFLFLVSVVIAASAEDEFSPLLPEERIVAEVGVGDDGQTRALYVYRTEPGARNRSLLFVAVPYEGGVQIVDDGKLAFVPRGERIFSSLWFIDGTAGSITRLPIADASMIPTNNGGYICYVDLQYMEKRDTNSPRVSIYDVRRKRVVVTRDFKEKKYEWTYPDFSYEPDQKRFKLVFYAEDRLMGTEYLRIPNEPK